MAAKLMTSPPADRGSGARRTYLVAGHTTLDVIASGSRFGGSVAYAAIAGLGLGLNVRVVTAHAADVDTGLVFKGTETVTLPSKRTTSFRNREELGVRVQDIVVVGDMMSTRELTEKWRRPDVLHLAPVFREIDAAFARWFKPRLCCATLQGWMRTKNSSGRVLLELVDDWEELLALLDIAIFSYEDIKHDIRLRDTICEIVPICVVTRGSEGCEVIERGRRQYVPATPIQVSDSTGAGDVFATAFFSEYASSGDSERSARFANRFAARTLTSGDFRDVLMASDRLPTE